MTAACRSHLKTFPPLGFMPAMASKSWKEELDEKLSRLHSLLFGMEAACDRQEWEKALGLGLCLLGFLSSQCRTEEDRVYVDPIRKRVQRLIDVAKGHQYKLVEQNAFSAADRKPGLAAFQTSGPVDIEKVKNSRFFKPFASQTDAVAPSSRFKTPSVDNGNNRKRQLHASSAAAKSSFANDWKLPNKPRLPVVHRREEEDKDVRKKSTGSDAVDEERHKGKSLGYASETAKRKRETSEPGFETRGEDDMDVQMQDATMPTGFVTAKQKWAVDGNTKGRLGTSQNAGNGMNSRTTLGVSRRGARSGFVPPFRANAGGMATSMGEQAINESTSKCLELLSGPDGELPDKLRNLEPRLLEHISNEIMEKDSNVRWDDIAGLDYAKKCVTEMVIWPLLRPDLFHGCRSPEKGLLLFGPPGTGKTMIGKAIANEAKATFFSISASSLTSKWIGEGEKLVRALFGVASCRQPAVIFIDEVDSLLSQRKSEGEHESSRRIKTQFLIEMEGIGSGNEQLLLIGATNRPQELDEAARRRFTKRLYIPLPCADARAWIVRNLLRKDGLLFLSDNDIEAICSSTEGYSGSDMKNLVKEASMWPLREALKEGKDINKLNSEEMRPISLEDFNVALQQVRPSVSKSELGTYEEWNRQFGSLSFNLN